MVRDSVVPRNNKVELHTSTVRIADEAYCSHGFQPMVNNAANAINNGLKSVVTICTVRYADLNNQVAKRDPGYFYRAFLTL